MNKVILIGRLTKDPEVRHTESNLAVAKFTLAVDRAFKNDKGEREADFINIVAWKNQAENVGKYIKQGSQVAIEGRIQTRKYEDEEGNKHYITEVVADNVNFISSKSTQEAPKVEEKPKEEKLPTSVFEEFGNDLPFEA